MPGGILELHLCSAIFRNQREWPVERCVKANAPCNGAAQIQSGLLQESKSALLEELNSTKPTLSTGERLKKDRAFVVKRLATRSVAVPEIRTIS